jgi:hypothetical protein
MSRRDRDGDYGGGDTSIIKDWSGVGGTEPEESCNAYYHRKMSTNKNQVSGDGDTPLQGRDDSFAEERLYGERERSHINQKTGRY